MANVSRLLARIAVVALSYAVVGRLSVLMAIPPGYATAVWPSAGIALAAVLFFGHRVLPGVLLGSFLVNVGTSASSSGVAVAGGLAVGAALQAFTGAALIRRSVGFPTSFGRERDVGTFMLLGGPVACVVSATVGSTVLFASGAVRAGELCFEWFTWWVGDTIGVLLVAPLSLLFAATPRSAWRSRGLAVALPSLVGAAAVISLFSLGNQRVEESIDSEFRLRTDRLVDAVRDDLASHAEVLHSTAGYLGLVGSVDGASFRQVTARSFERHPGLQELSFAAVVPAARRVGFEREAARDLRDFRILERGSGGGLVPAGAREQYVPVRLVEPVASRSSVLGLDLLSEPIMRELLLRARELGAVAVSADPGPSRPTAPEGLSVTAALPISPAGAGVPASGFVMGTFAMGEIVRHALRPLPHPGIDIELSTEHAPAAPLESAETEHPLAYGPGRGLGFDVPLAFGDHRFALRIRAADTYLAAHRGWQAWAVLVTGLLFTSLLGAFLLTMTGRAIAVEELVAEKTAQLASRNDLFQRLTDAVISVGPDFRITSWNGGAEEMYGFPAHEVLGRDTRSLFRTIYPEGATADALFSELMERGTWTGELLHHTSDGRVLNVLVSASASKDEHGRFRGIVSVNRDVTAIRDAELRLVSSLKEKEVLLKEVHHRVKNNLQVISSLLSLQSRHVSDSAARALLEESQSRVQSIALVHERLYQAADLSHVDLQYYLDDLINGLLVTFREGGAAITCTVELEDVRLPIDLAISCGLIVNELVINSLKYAFPSGRGSIRVSGRREGERISLVVADDGVGLPEDLDPSRTTSLGLELVFTFAEQLGAAVTWSREGGTVFEFSFSRAK